MTLAREPRVSSHEPVLFACAHGTRNPSGQAAVAQLVAEVRRRLDPVPVIDTWVDVQEPGLSHRTAQFRAESAVVVPLLLSAGYHVYVDMARAVKGNAHHKVAAALGPDPRLAVIMARRVNEALAEHGAPPLTEHDTVIMAAAGSSEPDAVRDCVLTAEHLADELGTDVRVAFLSAVEPTVRDAVAEARSRLSGRGSAVGRVLVATYLLAPGFFHDKAVAAGADLTAEPLLSPDAPPPAELTQLVIEHYELRARA